MTMQPTFDFLSNGGEMGALMRAHDWNATPLGEPRHWPEILKTTVRLLLTSNHPMFIWWGKDLIQFYNDAYRKTMGPERHPSALGQRGRECWDEIWDIIGPQIEFVMAGCGATWHEDQLVPVTRHGSREDVWWTYGYSPIEDSRGVQGVLVVCTDVTVEHQSREQLRELNRQLVEQIREREEAQQREALEMAERLNAERLLADQRKAESERLHALFQQAPGFMAIVRGPHHVFEFANEAYLRLIGGRTLVGKPVRQALPDVDGQGFFELLDEVFCTGKPFSAMDVPLLLRREPDGPSTQAYVDFVYQPIIDMDGSVSGIFIEGFDVTERTLAKKKLQDADRRKDEFLAMLAHELRNPLAPLKNAADLLRLMPQDDARLRHVHGLVSRQVKHMTGLIDDLLDVSRVNSGLIVLDKQPLDIRQIVAESVEQVQPLIAARRHQLDVNLAVGPVFVQGDHKRLVQVFTNLLQNAAKYTPEGGRISLVALTRTGEVVIEIRDNGIGIDAELLPHVFELFTQGKRSSDRSQGGLGLGLALVQNLVALHGGRVAVATQGQGKGSTLTVILPCRSEGPAGMPPRAVPAVLERSCQPLRVMVVDDNADAAQALTMVLDACGHQVTVEHDPHSVLAHAGVASPDVYLLDIGLPGMTGNELARRLRRTPHSAAATLIAVTGYGNEYDREKALAAGFDFYFVKPLDATQLHELLSTIRPGRSRPHPAHGWSGHNLHG
ncbi:ATP-binding protein [Noviherbaspirillum sp. UKPF54]|uniref:hybrid sensor histidine kinase/response regulator n=1 Tax=Noviherbaspirillum sp. UKPF54 TaxID=2601898 RepID=UPI0011B104C1|nr:ATP-binding protein [Noviherbaspirillum sp. UKPF54]QDZ29926.1 response regulator [Noviherbaspirillum sp. UKPF54]